MFFENSGLKETIVFLASYIQGDEQQLYNAIIFVILLITSSITEPLQSKIRHGQCNYLKIAVCVPIALSTHPIMYYSETHFFLKTKQKANTTLQCT